MSWKRWKLGLVVAAVSALCDGLVVALADPTIATRALLICLVVMMAKAMGLFLKQHPVEAVTEDTEVLTKAGVSRGDAEGKVNGNLPALAFAAALGLCFLSGCALLDKAAGAVSSPVVTSHQVTNVVTNWVVVTNVVREVVTVPGETNTVTNVVTQLVTNTVTVPLAQTVYLTNWVEKASLESGLKLARAGAAFVPPPYGTAATAALGIVSAGLALLVRRKNQQAQVLTDANDSLGTQLQAVVKGVEQVTTAIDPATGAKVKGIIAETSKALGVADDLHATVQELTKV